MVGDKAVVALGSNLDSFAGNPGLTVKAAIARLAELASGPLAPSSPYVSVPQGCEPGAADFVNAVVLFEPAGSMTPTELLQKLLDLENEFGRQRIPGGHHSRTLDLDLISWGQRICQDSRLQLPHPRAQERGFVLAPLAELDPEFRFPGATLSVAKLLEHLPSWQREIRRLSWSDF